MIRALSTLESIRDLHDEHPEDLVTDPTLTAVGGATFSQRYHILKSVGAGGMGEVLCGRDQILKRTVALKFLHEAGARDPVVKRRFLREARAAAGLDHPNIAPVYDAGETEDGRAYIAMAYYEAQSLKDRIAKGPIPLEEAREIAIKLARALAYAHGEGIIHRDLKPGNVLLTVDGEVKLIDFGLARRSESSVLTRDGSAFGTPAYMSPEQIRGERVDQRTDIWSLGVILHEMVAGRRPFTGDNVEQLTYAIVHDEPKPLPRRIRHGAADVGAVVDKALAKAREERYAEIGGVLEDLAGLAAVALNGQLRRSPGRRTWWLAAAAILVSVAAFLVVNRLEGPQEEPLEGVHDAIAVMPFENLSGDPGLSHIAEGLPARMIARLSEVRGLSVVERSRAWGLADKVGRPGVVGESLGASDLVVGELHRLAGKYRFDLRIVDTATAKRLWSKSFECMIEEIYSCDGEILTVLSRVLAVPLSAQTRVRLTEQGPSAQAFDVYLRGLEQLEDRASTESARTAATLFRQAISMDGDVAIFYVGLSDALWRQYILHLPGVDLKQAEVTARRALEMDEALPGARVALARALRAQGKDHEAISEVRDVLGKHPKPDQAFRELAASLMSIDDVEGAEESFRAAVALNPESWVNWNSLGVFQAKSGKMDSAIESLERARELAPAGVVWPSTNLGGVKIARGKISEAKAILELAGETQSPRHLANLATANFYLGDLDSAARLYRTAIELDPDEAMHHGNLADTLLEQGDEQGAAEEYRRALRATEGALERAPGRQDLELSLMVYSAKAGECRLSLETATEQADRLTDSRSQSWPAWLDIGIARALCKDNDGALSALRQAVAGGLAGDSLASYPEFKELASDPGFEDLAIAKTD